MSSFTGFTDDPPSAQPEAPGNRQSKMSTKKQKEKLLVAAANRKTNSVIGCSDSLPAGARLAQPPPPTTPVKLRVSDDGKCEIVPGGDPPTTNVKSAESSGLCGQGDENVQNPAPENAEAPLPDSKLSKLEAFQEKQKLIEEQNRKRKEMLSKAIMDRKKKTDSESKKLDLVQQELQKIDSLLNTDVQFLRDSIEQASFEFMEAQKRYDKAETEFVESKLHLFSVMERKELLTDHLCAIIEQNENRKAKKLNALMEELQLDVQQ
eukprot:GFUD01121400.1.p1 GENE.GFUD01121400.1~~GFUD01121400.1.p1  ORF type:complete len:264 (+),score=90.81 GFUD01121400.1:113-904(+)